MSPSREVQSAYAPAPTPASNVRAMVRAQEKPPELPQVNKIHVSSGLTRFSQLCNDLKLVQKNLCKSAILKKTKNCFLDQFSLNAGQKYCRMLPLEHSTILLTFIKLPFVIKMFVLSIFQWLFTLVLLY